MEIFSELPCPLNRIFKLSHRKPLFLKKLDLFLHADVKCEGRDDKLSHKMNDNIVCIINVYSKFR